MPIRETYSLHISEQYVNIIIITLDTIDIRPIVDIIRYHIPMSFTWIGYGRL